MSSTDTSPCIGQKYARPHWTSHADFCDNYGSKLLEVVKQGGFKHDHW